MYKHIFITDILCLIMIALLGAGEIIVWFVWGGAATIIFFVITVISFLIQTFATIYDIIDYHNYKEIEKIEKEIAYLIKRAMDAEGDF